LLSLDKTAKIVQSLNIIIGVNPNTNTHAAAQNLLKR